ncbi:MAG: haloacid dehalogenase-like hydrolase [Candidatus Bathyarchaeia archaeon]|jgi:phosphoserine phosphatase/dolichol kinase
MERRRLAVFDVEGVLIPKRRYLLFEVGRKLRFSQFIRIALFGVFYELGLISLKSTMKHVFRVFKGFSQDELIQIFKQTPLLPGVKEVFEKLHSTGWKTALISSGLPNFVVNDLASTLGADYAFGFELGVRDGVVTGEIWGDSIEHDGKLTILKRILETEGLTPKDCVVVVDDRNNASLMLPEILKIGYNPDFIIRMKADHVVTGYPLEVLSIIQGQPKTHRLPSKNDAVREIIHASGIAVPFLSSLIGIYPVAYFILFVTAFYVISELTIMERGNLPVISSITRHATTPEEQYEFRAAPIFYAFGILFTLLLFPRPASYAAIVIFVFGDSAASIFGKMFGRNVLAFNKGKTLEGSLFGFVFAFSAAVFFVNPFIAASGAAAAMLIETLPLPINDNLVLPLVTGALLTLLL